MGAISFVFKCALNILNGLLSTLGVLMITIGIILAAGGEVVTYLEDEFEDELQRAYTEAGVTVDSSNFSLTDLLFPAGVAFIGVGALILAVAIIGSIALCCSFSILLTVYAVVLITIFLPQFIIVLIVYIDDSVLEDVATKYLKYSLHEFTGLEGTDSSTVMWNAIMVYEDCCGVDDYNDFHDPDVTNWPPATINGQTLNNQKTPVACCKTLTANDYTCAETDSATDTNNNQNEGCYSKVYETVTGNALVVTIIIFSLLIQAACIFMVIWIKCHKDNTIGLM